MMRIHALPTHVANQIAAGEVIERPASVVKELLENALDSGASRIQVEIDSSGFNLIRVSDNGSGIVADDLPLAIMPHATSKIRAFSDLSSITTMGFRGEALASIASVSRLTIQSKPAIQDNAMMLFLDESGLQIKPCARTVGTTIEVRDLFYNAPVRKTFLKSARMEYQAIEHILKRFAFSEPTISLSFKQDGKTVFSLATAQCQDSVLARIKTILGNEFAREAIYLDVNRAGMRLRGWVGGPNYHRSQNDKQWFYLNRRMLKDKLLNHAIQQAYQDLLYPGRYPAYLLYLTVSPQEVDVNVHPTKHEVRFQQPRLVHDMVSSQIARILQDALDAHSTQESDERILEVREPRIAYQSNAVLEAQALSVKNKFERLHSSKMESTSCWTTLNAEYIVWFFDNTPYLINISRLLKLRSEHNLKQEPKPLATRPLLVPITCAIDRNDYTVIEQLKPLCERWGIDMDFVSESSVLIRALPRCVPALDISKFIRNLSSCDTEEALFNLLIESQHLDAYQYTEEEKQDIMSYAMQQLPWLQQQKNAVVILDVKQCQRLFHEA